MSRRKRTATKIVRAVQVRPPAPIIRVSAPRASTPKRKRRSRRSHGGGGKGGSPTLTFNRVLAHFGGGAGVGYIEKHFGASLPSIPVIGKKGTIAAIAYFLRGKAPLAAEVCLSAAAIAGYEFGATGKVSGDVDGDIAEQVRGLAAQV